MNYGRRSVKSKNKETTQGKIHGIDKALWNRFQCALIMDGRKPSRVVVEPAILEYVEEVENRAVAWGEVKAKFRKSLEEIA